MSGPDELEQRLRTALQAVAELPTPATTTAFSREGGARSHWDRPRRAHRGPVAIAVSLAAVAAAVALLVAYGPQGGSPGRHPSIPAGHPATTGSGPSSTLTPSTPTTGATTQTTTTQTTTGSVPPDAGTQQISYHAFYGTQIDPSLHVTGQQSGACFEYGGGADGRDYYRCGTMQPCFAGSAGTSAPLVCPQSPVTSNDVVLWSATSVDTSMVPVTRKIPWAMELSDGEVCTLVDAAWSGLGPFACAGTPVADCHQPQASTTFWTADCQAQESATSPFSATTVEKVWF